MSTKTKTSRQIRAFTKPALRRTTTIVAIIGAAIAGYVICNVVGATVAALLAACCRWFDMSELECEEHYPSERSLFAMPVLVLYAGTFFGTSLVAGLGEHWLGFGANVAAMAGTIAWLLTVGYAAAVIATWVGNLSTKFLRWDWR